MGRTKNPTLQELKPEATAFGEAPEAALYWFGMLPASKSFKIKRSTRDKNRETNDYFEWVSVTSEELWGSQPSQWVGRCPWFQSLSVNGFAFDAFTETLTRPIGSVEGGLLNRISWPGAVMELDIERFHHIIRQCYRNVIRVKDGVGKEINLDQPKSYQMLNDGTEKVVTESYNPRTDTYFAHYVYMVKTDAKPEEYDPGTYYRLAMPWNQFFTDCPKSVAEVYPLGKDGKVIFGTPEAPK